MRLLHRLTLALALPLAACSSPHTGSASPPAPSGAGARGESGRSGSGGESGSGSDGGGAALAQPEDAGAGAVGNEGWAPEPTFDEIASLLYAGSPNNAALADACATSLPREARVRCLFGERYRGDLHAARLANELFTRWQVVAGVEVAHTMDGGYRGMIRVEPALPLNAERKHIEWIADAFRDFDAFFGELDRVAASSGPPSAHASRPRYRFRPITLRFMRSVAARTPSAYASEWTVAWNLAGSLHTSGYAVRETLFHEIFHLNDAAHGSGTATTPVADEWWSIGALGGLFDGIVRKCGTKIPCLAPYSPNDTIVRGGTYYSFQPGNGVREYAAELALRYYREQRAAMRSGHSTAAAVRVRPFKCGPPENARAWELVKDEFFGGIDAVPPCPH